MKRKLISLLCLCLVLLTGCGKSNQPSASTKPTASATPSASTKPTASATPSASMTPKMTLSPAPSLNPDPIPTAVIPPVNTPQISPQVEITGMEELREVFTSGSRYTVRDGDCLWSISSRIFGNGAEWQKLWECNMDTLESPSLVYPGQVLIIP